MSSSVAIVEELKKQAAIAQQDAVTIRADQTDALKGSPVDLRAYTQEQIARHLSEIAARLGAM